MINFKEDIHTKIISGRLGKRFAILILAFSSCFTILSTSIQLALDYRADISRIEQQFNNIENSYLQTITLSIWSLDDSQIETQLAGLSQLPDIEYVSIIIEKEISWEQGEARSSATKTVDFPLNYSAPGIASQDIGILRVTASIDNVYNRLIDKAGVILVSNGIKTFLVSGFILFLIWMHITRHLQSISLYLKHLDFDKLTTPLNLNKKIEDDKHDEIDTVANTINHMRLSLHKTYKELNENKKHLQSLVEQRDALLESERQYKETLEQRVMERTQQLENSMDNLKSAQDLLVETEKMAALGNMVAGVAHEINTPIGVCRTASSYQHDSSRQIRRKFEDGALTQTDLSKFLDGIDESSALFETNIVKASKLISSFKLIATDQSYDAIQSFNLENYLKSSIQTIYPQFKNRHVTFDLDIPKNIVLDSYPGALHYVLSNLINNSTIHGFEHEQGGTISISAETKGQDLFLTYSDDGRGLSEEESKKIFEPFFTTKRGKGGSGLGMSIVYNIVSSQLKGRLEIKSTKTKGFNLLIIIPLVITAEEAHSSESTEPDPTL